MSLTSLELYGKKVSNGIVVLVRSFAGDVEKKSVTPERNLTQNTVNLGGMWILLSVVVAPHSVLYTVERLNLKYRETNGLGKTG
jgi:hypothetical protein